MVNINWNTEWPTVFDLGHISLAGLSLFFFLLMLVFMCKKKKPAASISATAPKDRPVSELKPATPEKTPTLVTGSPEGAMELLAQLQSKARFIDFIQEDLTGFSDAEVGIAARVVHEGGKQVLKDHFSLEPVRTEAEESQVILEEGFDAHSVRISGQLSQEPPFKGILIHKGWKAVDVRLPSRIEGQDVSILAPAEVEL